LIIHPDVYRLRDSLIICNVVYMRKLSCDISGWMTNNNLRINANKTDFIIIGTSRQRSKLTHFFPTNILSHSITPSDTVCNLGVTFDSNFNCHSCFFHIRDLHHIRFYIFLSVAKTIATVLITSRLDYCIFSL